MRQKKKVTESIWKQKSEAIKDKSSFRLCFLLVKIAESSENDSLVLPPFLSYSPPGVVAAADLMYANYGTVEDFEELEERNLSCIGKIMIMRYGKIFRGNKVTFDC